MQFIGIDHPAMDQSIVARGIIDEDAAIVFLANDKMNCHGQIITIAELDFEIGTRLLSILPSKDAPKKSSPMVVQLMTRTDTVHTLPVVLLPMVVRSKGHRSK